jgi:hypothetical protein
MVAVVNEVGSACDRSLIGGIIWTGGRSERGLFVERTEAVVT